LSTGLYSAIGILMALYERNVSGRGQFIDMTLHDCGLAMLHPQGANFLLGGRRPVALGNPHPNLAPCDKFATRNGEIFIVVGNDGQFRRLSQALGCPALAADPRFKTNSDRVFHKEELAGELQTAMADRDNQELATELLKCGVPAGPVLYVDEALASAQTQHRGSVIDAPAYRGIGTPIRFSRSRHEGVRAPPRFGEHNAEILMEHGFGGEEPARLRSAGIVRDQKKADAGG